MIEVLVAVLAIVVLILIVTVGSVVMAYRTTKDDRRQRQILEAQVEAQHRLAMLTHASLQAVRSQGRSR